MRLFVLISITCSLNANASPMASFTAIEPTAWLKQGDIKSKLSRDSVVEFGDQIITSDTGKVEVRLDSTITMQIDVNSEISIHETKNIDTSDVKNLYEVVIHNGQVCVQYNSKSGTAEKFNLNIGGSTFVSIDFEGEVCVQRQKNLSELNLLKGSIQVTHAVNPDLLVLSESGTILSIDDKGEFQFLASRTELAIATPPEKPVNTEVTKQAKIADEVLDVIDSYITEDAVTVETTPEAVENKKVTEEVIADEPATIQPVAIIDTEKDKTGEETIAGTEQQPLVKEQTSDYIYTVYLFSTRSEEVAQKANQKFLKAKYKTQIFTTADGEVTRYRVAASGFETYKAAQDFSKSIIGKLGVKDTWIGKQKRVSE